jgi:hypothetical protein
MRDSAADYSINTPVNNSYSIANPIKQFFLHPINPSRDIHTGMGLAGADSGGSSRPRKCEGKH